MLIHFLQRRDPPLLPSLQASELVSWMKSDGLLGGHRIQPEWKGQIYQWRGLPLLHRSSPNRKGDGLLERCKGTKQGQLQRLKLLMCPLVMLKKKYCNFWNKLDQLRPAVLGDSGFAHIGKEDVGSLLLEFFRYFGNEYRWVAETVSQVISAVVSPVAHPWQEWYHPNSRYSICAATRGWARIAQLSRSQISSDEYVLTIHRSKCFLVVDNPFEAEGKLATSSN